MDFQKQEIWDCFGDNDLMGKPEKSCELPKGCKPLFKLSG